MSAYAVQIGNSDNKLTQREWAAYWWDMNIAVQATALELNLHFSGGSSNWEPWQNYCWVFNPDPNLLDEFLADVKRIRAKYRQDSVAITVGETMFV